MMLGLGDYESSDEEGRAARPKHQTDVTTKATAPHTTDIQTPAEPDQDSNKCIAQSLESTASSSESRPRSTHGNAMAAGPTAGPAAGPATAPDRAPEQTPDGASAPPSPYSVSRSVVRNLTMPRVPKFEIPPSPPGSPPPGPSAKFARFLELKKKGVHFNEKLERSSLLRNPSLLLNLMDFAGINEGDQHANTLSEDAALPVSFPTWAYADQLGKTQQELLKQREEEQRKTQREAVDFVPATVADTVGAGDGRGTSAAERVRAGLNRDNAHPATTAEENRAIASAGKRKSRFRSRSRSPRRKRSMSR